MGTEEKCPGKALLMNTHNIWAAKSESVPSDVMCAQQRFRSACTDAQADLCLCWASMSKGTFSHVVAQSKTSILFMPPLWIMPGACSFFGFPYVRTWVHAYVCMSVRPSVRMCLHTYVHDPVRLRLRHLYQVEFCSLIVRYPTAGASMYCGHISSFVC